ncbi:MAG: PKD domain-containing protein [Bacteroidia bacterium]
MNIAKKLFYLLPAFLLLSLSAVGQTLSVDFTLSASKKCMDSSFTFDASTATTYSGSGTLEYQWDFGDNTTGSNNAKQTKTYSGVGSFDVRLIVVSSDGLRDTAIKSVKVYPLPVVKFGYSSNNCQRSEMYFYDSSLVSSGYVNSIKWTFEPGRTSTSATAIHVFSDAKTYDVKLEVWTDKGCYKSLTKKVIIRPTPDADFNYVSSCEDTVISLDAGASTGSISGYKWVFPDGSTASTKTTSKLFAAGIHNIKLITYNATSGCHDSVEKRITVYDKPKVDFLVKNTCQDTVFYIVNKTKPTFGAIQELFIYWDVAGAPNTFQRIKAPFASDTIYHVYKPNPLKSYQIRITARTTYGCDGTSSTYRAEVRGKPKAAFTTSGGCLDSLIQFIDKSTIPTGNAGFVKYWFWNFGDSTAGVPNTSTLQNPTHKYKKPGTYKVSLIAATDAGCTDTVRNQLVTVAPAPMAYFIYTTDCKNKPIQFKDTSVISEGTVVGWYWNFGDSVSSANTSTLKSPTHSFGKPGSYTVMLVAYSDKGCKDTFREVVTVYPDAAPDFTYSGTCERSLITFTDKSTAPTGATIDNYEWDFGDQNVDKTNSKIVAHAYQNSGKYTVRLTVTTSDGCPIFVEKFVIVIPAPKASFSNTPTCIDKEAAFTNTTTIIDPSIPVTYSWNFGDPVSGANNTSTLKNPTHTYKLGGQYTVKMVATSGNGCKDSVTKIIEASTVPKSNFSFVNLCNDSAMHFSDASTISGSVITQRIWYWNDGSARETGNNKTPSHAFPTAGKYDVSLVTVTVAGCRDSITKTVETFPKPTANFSYITHCADTAIQFTNTSTMAGTDTVYGYKWNFGDGSTSTEKNPSHKFSAGGAYTVTLYAFSNLGCADTMIKTVNVLSRPIPKIEPVGAGGNRCANKEVTFPDEDNNDGIISKFWKFGDGDTSTANEPTHTYKAAGTYTVELTAKNANGCDSTIKADVVIDALPLVKIGWVGGCAGDPITFRDSSTTQSGKKRGVLRIPAKNIRRCRTPISKHSR